MADLAAKGLARSLDAFLVEWHKSRTSLGDAQIRSLGLQAKLERDALRCAHSGAPWSQSACYVMAWPGLMVKDTPGANGASAGFDVAGERLDSLTLEAAMATAVYHTPWRRNPGAAASISQGLDGLLLSSHMQRNFSNLLKNHFWPLGTQQRI